MAYKTEKTVLNVSVGAAPDKDGFGTPISHMVS